MGRGSGRNMKCFSCVQIGHYAAQCPQRAPQFLGPRPTVSEPTVGDAGRAHRVFAAVDQ